MKTAFNPVILNPGDNGQNTSEPVAATSSPFDCQSLANDHTYPFELECSRDSSSHTPKSIAALTNSSNSSQTISTTESLHNISGKHSLIAQGSPDSDNSSQLSSPWSS